METIGEQEQEGKKLTYVKTFTVPFPLQEINGNTDAFAKDFLKFSKEELINQSFKLHSQGNISEAAKYYKHFVEKGYKDPRVFSNYGVILKDFGNLNEAKQLQLNAIQIQPDFVEAYSNYANILIEIGNFQEAEISIRKAIKLKPDYPNAHYNLGTILIALRKINEAEISIRKAIELKPDFIDAYLNLGSILNDLTRFQEAFDSYLEVIKISPNETRCFCCLLDFLKYSNYTELNKNNLIYSLNLLLKRDDIHHQHLFKLFNFLYKNELIRNHQKLSDLFLIKDKNFQVFIDNELLNDGMRKFLFKDPEWEHFLIRVRRIFCNEIVNNKEKIQSSHLKFIMALAEQCFLNEYIYSIDVEEIKLLDKLMILCKKGDLNKFHISILACYYPIYKLLDQIPSIKSYKLNDISFKNLYKLQVSEPLEEIELSKKIKKIGKTDHDISKKVKSQYEENPYPRWRYENISKDSKVSASFIINSEIKPNYISTDLGSRKLKVLIAGCGTGKQIMQALRYKNVDITAIDLSNASLSFAQRKINELDINCVNLIQMDILEVSLLKEKFDIIECCGVLHHMADPQQGLNSLLEILKPKGYMRLALYTELSRKVIVKTREYIQVNKINSDIDSMRNLRKDIFSGKHPELYSLTGVDFDFYNSSNFRDLCFHFQEHRFTFKQLDDMLISQKLNFLGFLLPPKVKLLYKRYFPDDKLQATLKNWAEVERRHPGIFGGTPSFWVSRFD